MKKILIIGSGAMGAAFSFPLLDNNHKVTLSEPYNFKLIKKLNLKKKFHPNLNINLSSKLTTVKFTPEILNNNWDLIVISVSSIGIDLISKQLKNFKKKIPILVLTKGLKLDKTKKIITMSEQIKKNNKKLNISVLKGPCLAKELARKIKSYTIIANKNIKIAKKIGKLISTTYYKTEYSSDIRGIEFSSAIKNIYSMLIGSAKGNNTSSALFRKSIQEMEYLIKFFKGKKETVYGLAGLADLYVSAVGGRNSKMGEYLGQGMKFKEAKKTKMPNTTVEGADLALEIGAKVKKDFDSKTLPLMISMINTICEEKPLKVDWKNFK